MEARMVRNYWSPEELRNAARLLVDAADNLHVGYPHSNSRPNPTTLPAVEAMIASAKVCIQMAQPAAQ
jgi:hypothetical protein